MATIRLIPSAYTLSNTNYCTQTNVSNMYANTDSTTVGNFRGRAGRSSNSTYYAFLRGFNFSDVPSNATVSSFKVKIKAYRGSYQATGSSYRIRLASSASSSSAISNTTMSEDITTTSGGTVYEIPTGSLTWATLSGCGSNFSIEIPLRNSSTSSSNYPYVYVYGAEIEVTYTLPNPRTITSTLSGSGTIDPSGAQTYYDGDTYTLTITPTNTSDTVTATKDGTSITSQLVHHTATSGTESKTAASYTTSGTISNSTYVSYPVGYTAESPNTYSSNVYASNQGYEAYVEYSFDFSAIPVGATISSIEVKCSGQRENASNGPCSVTLYSGTTQKGSTQDFTSTSQQVITVATPGTWTRDELQDAKLRWAIGYYGGRLYGITWNVTYSVQDCYTYTYTVSGNATIAVTIGGGGTTITWYKKVNGSWVSQGTVTAVYKKVNGSWVQQSDISSAISSSTNYIIIDS